MKLTFFGLILLTIHYSPCVVTDSNERLQHEIINPVLLDIGLKSNLKENMIIDKIGSNHVSIF